MSELTDEERKYLKGKIKKKKDRVYDIEKAVSTGLGSLVDGFSNQSMKLSKREIRDFIDIANLPFFSNDVAQELGLMPSRDAWRWKFNLKVWSPFTKVLGMQYHNKKERKLYEKLARINYGGGGDRF